MQLLHLSALASLIGLVLFVLYYAAKPAAARANAWMFPAALSAGFALFSIYTIFIEGILPVWINHTSNLWGNQVWFDLLIGFGISWVFLVSEGRRLGMSPWPWALTLFATGNIGLLAMLARILYLRNRAGVST